MKGEEDSLSFNDEVIVGDNKRTYLVTGLQWDGSMEFTPSYTQSLELKFGFRIRRQIERDHTEQSYLMQSGTMVLASDDTVETNQYQDSSESNSGYIEAVHTWQNFRWTIGSRTESVKTVRKDGLNPTAEDITNEDQITTFGTGVNYQLTPHLGLLAGINQGVTLVGPGQDDEIKPEEALNQEIGFRYSRNSLLVQSIAFRSDYSNIKGTCSVSSGCTGTDLDREFNGGEALIQGLELSVRDRISFSSGDLFGNLSYTYTDATFSADTSSQNPEWGVGDIVSGDPLPYISEHNFSAQIGFATQDWELALSYHNKSEMYDQAIEEGRYTIPSYSVIDFNAAWNFTPEQQAFIKADNILDQDYVVAARPYGLRPGKPLFFTLGYSGPVYKIRIEAFLIRTQGRFSKFHQKHRPFHKPSHVNDCWICRPPLNRLIPFATMDSSIIL